MLGVWKISFFFSFYNLGDGIQNLLWNSFVSLNAYADAAYMLHAYVCAFYAEEADNTAIQKFRMIYGIKDFADSWL